MKCFLVIPIALVFIACDPLQPGANSPAAPPQPTQNTPSDVVAKTAGDPADEVRVLEKITILAEDPADDRLTILLHGYGSNERDLPSLAGRFGLRGPVLSYQAPIELQTDRYAWFARDFRANPTAEKTEQFDTSVRRLVASIEEQREEHPDKRIVVAGFSQGGMMTATLAAEHGELIDFAIVLSGAMPRDLGTSAGTPKVYIAHGDADRVVKKEAADVLAQSLESKGLDVAYRVYPGMAHRILPAVTNDVREWLERGR